MIDNFPGLILLDMVFNVDFLSSQCFWHGHGLLDIFVFEIYSS